MERRVVMFTSNPISKAEIAKQWKFYHLTQKLITDRYTCDRPFMLNTVVTTRNGSKLRLTREELADVADWSKPMKSETIQKVLALEHAIADGICRKEGVLERLPSRAEDRYEMPWMPYMQSDFPWSLEKEGRLAAALAKDRSADAHYQFTRGLLRNWEKNASWEEELPAAG
jgi:hypothetical protein